MLMLTLGFNPETTKDPEMRLVFEDKVATTLWLLWKRSHLVNSRFPGEVLLVAEQIRKTKPTTAVQLGDCFRQNIASWAVSNFILNDVSDFCPEYLPYFTGEKLVDYIVRGEQQRLALG